MRWWPLSTCFAVKMIQSFPGKLAFDDLAFDDFPIMCVPGAPIHPSDTTSAHPVGAVLYSNL